MCLILEEKGKVVKIRNNRVCYKVVKEKQGKLIPEYRSFVHPKYVLNKKNIVVEIDKGRFDGANWQYNIGYHSFKSLRTAKQYLKLDHRSGHIIVKCIIPKGSEIILGRNAFRQSVNYPMEYLSNQIIIKEILEV